MSMTAEWLVAEIRMLPSAELREVCDRLGRLMTELNPPGIGGPARVSDAEFEAALDEVTGCTAGSGSLNRLLLDRRQELERELACLRERAK